MSGWIKLHRKLQQNPMWLAEPFTRGQAWADLLMLANYEAGYLRVRGVRVDVPRGSVGWAKESLATRWKWSRGKVNRFISELEADGQVVQQTGQPLNAIKLCNYNEYNSLDESSSTPNGTTDGTPSSTTDGTSNGHQTVHEEEVKEEEEGKEVKKKKGKIKFIPPAEISKKDWADYEEHRRRLSKPMTDRARKSMAKAIIECAAFNNATTAEVIDYAVGKGWVGVGSDWAIGGNSKSKELRTANGESMNKSLADELRAEEKQIIEGELV